MIRLDRITIDKVSPSLLHFPGVGAVYNDQFDQAYTVTNFLHFTFPNQVMLARAKSHRLRNLARGVLQRVAALCVELRRVVSEDVAALAHLLRWIQIGSICTPSRTVY